MRETIDGALRRQRIAVVLAVVVGLLTSVGTGAGRGTAGLLALLPLVVCVGLLVRQFRLPPSGDDLRMDERERALYAPPRAGVTLVPLLVGLGAYQTANSWPRAGDGSFRLALTVSFALLTVVFAVLFWRRVPGVQLTPEGITHRRHERQWFVPWADLDPAGRVGSPRGSGVVSLPLGRPGSSRDARGRGSVAVRDLDAAPERIAAAIRHYLTHSDERAEIGTPQGYARLRRALDGDA
ncbi:hypothetical protein [Micromonospora psammae]|uniref:hypothetical protein n=1 Tax=Micromonospora sp. CPCC 205556 TaxID=3122398 RepID=UPI002FEF18A6